MTEYITIDQLLIENNELKLKVDRLEKQLKASNKRTSVFKERADILKDRIHQRICEERDEVLKCFEWCKSIKDTACEYGIDMDELYRLIPMWYDSHSEVVTAKDYDECLIEVLGRHKYDDDDDEDKEINIRQRTPDTEEMNKIIEDYKEGKFSLYELADSYNLKINNLFRLLKDNNLIEKETDANGYNTFYTEYNGAGSYWDFESGMGLI